MTAKYLQIKLEPRAQQEIGEAFHWWQENRQAAPALFLDELTRALDLVRTQPHIGQHAQKASLKGVRRILLRRTRYLLYYCVLQNENFIIVLSLWHANRGRGPGV